MILSGGVIKNNIKTPWYVLNSPELGNPFQEFYEACKEKGVLDTKIRALLMTAMACVSNCSDCIEESIKRSLDAGATKEEITETILIATIERAGNQLDCKKDLYLKYLG
jgi:alkylhydroperoxidase/carboxymuconolactone decarboxylase family protein YurZ